MGFRSFLQQLEREGKVTRIKNNMAEVDMGGIKKDADIRMINDIKVGDYVLVHAGFAIEKIDPEHARETLELLREMKDD